MKILVADDHPLYRAGLRHVLAQLSESVTLVEAENHAQVESQATAQRDFSLVLLDLYMPGSHGIPALQKLVGQFPALPIVVLSASEDRADMQRAFDAGAMGFLPKSTPPAVMLSALRLVLDGGVYVPPELVRSNSDSSYAAAPLGGMKLDRSSDLTQRQSDVLAGVLEGKSNKAIAGELGLTEATVKAHITAVFKALKVSNRTQAALAVSRSNSSRS